jgi:hypothetical protein
MLHSGSSDALLSLLVWDMVNETGVCKRKTRSERQWFAKENTVRQLSAVLFAPLIIANGSLDTYLGKGLPPLGLV